MAAVERWEKLTVLAAGYGVMCSFAIFAGLAQPSPLILSGMVGIAFSFAIFMEDRWDEREDIP